MNTQFILPFQKEQHYLAKVASGKTDIVLNREKARGIYEDDDDIKEIAKDLFDAAKGGGGDMAQFIIVEEPDFMKPEECIIRTVLSKTGQTMYDNLQVGWCVSRKTGEVDVEETIRFYEQMLTKGSIREDFARAIIANKDERLRDLRSKLTLFRLTGKKDSGFFQEMDDA